MAENLSAKSVPKPEWASPVPTNAPKDAVHGFAEKVAKGLSFAPGDPIEPLVSRLGGRLAYKNAVDYESRLPESIVVMSQQNFTIFVPSMTSPERDRFTIAHELGHLFLHYPTMLKRHPGITTMVATRWVDENDSVQQRAEWEANWFAAAFLMPASDFRASFKRYGGNLTAVASMFAVSIQAAEVRRKNLGL